MSDDDPLEGLRRAYNTMRTNSVIHATRVYCLVISGRGFEAAPEVENEPHHTFIGYHEMLEEAIKLLSEALRLSPPEVLGKLGVLATNGDPKLVNLSREITEIMKEEMNAVDSDDDGSDL